jgi:hypothetical protein
MRFCSLMVIAVMALTIVIAAQECAQAGDGKFIKKIDELTGPESTRVEKIAALHSFVQTKVRNVATRFN